jgi:Glycosyltransferase family 87
MSRLPSRWLPDPAALVAAGVFLLCWALVHRWFWGAHQLVDWPTYKNYGDAIVHGHLVPYRDFALEYPPGALPVFALPSLFGNYPSAFSTEMAVCGALLVLVVGALRRAALPFIAVSPLLIGSMIFTRFDLWPALLVCASLLALVRGRDDLGWGLLGVAVAAKLWPLALVPLALGWSWRRGRRGAELAGVVTCLVFFVPFALVAPHGLWESLHGEADRPLQVESLGSAFAMTFGKPHVISSHGSQNLAGYGWLAALLALATAAVLVALWLAFWRGRQDEGRFLRYCAAAVCTVVAFGKVLSPQFLIWLVPVVPLVRGRRGLAATGLLTAALVLTQAYFPEHYFAYALGYHRARVVLLRDLVLVGIVAVLAWPSHDVEA